MNPHLLIVDDRPENLLSMSAWLEGDDRVIVTASSGNEALGALVRQEFAVVLLDVQMPGMTGFEMAELMRGSAKTREVPIIFVTAGDPQSRNALTGYGAGAVDYLTKPVDPDILRSKVDVFLRMFRQRQQLAEQAAVIDARNKELEDFARVVAHDLKEPLRLVSSFLSLIAANPHDDRETEYINYAVDGSKRMAERIDALLRFARAGRGEVELKRVSLADVVRVIEHDLGIAIEEAGASIVAEGLPEVDADRGALEHVLQNLIANAVKFRAPGRPPVVTVRAQTTPDGWQVEVADNGIGFQPEYADRIFKVFSRLHAQGTFEGTGIGLAVCQRIVARHGGRIWAEGEPDRGARFRFTLPRVLPGAE
jgi:two-component system, sensor histidine kinase and response regulator